MISIALAAVSEDGAYIDCDVETPDGALFLMPDIDRRDEVHRTVARIDTDACTFCGDCAQNCAFNAIVLVPSRRRALVFDDLCTGCGMCAYVCTSDAITEDSLVAGYVAHGAANALAFREGRMAIEAPHAHPTLSATLSDLPPRTVRILDAEPGSAGRVLTTLKASNVCLLVTEPTPFGLHDLKLAVELTRVARVPVGVIINRCDVGDDSVRSYCRSQLIPILLEIPFDPHIARTVAAGKTLLDARPDLESPVQGILNTLIRISNNGNATS